MEMGLVRQMVIMTDLPRDSEKPKVKDLARRKDLMTDSMTARRKDLDSQKEIGMGLMTD